MYRLRWSRRLSESKYLVHWSLCQKSKLELKTDVEAEHGLKARQSWVYRLSTQDAWLQATFEALRVVTEAKLDYFLHGVNRSLVWYTLKFVELTVL